MTTTSIILGVIAILWFATFLTLFPDYKYYSKVYNELNKMTFYCCDDLIHTKDWKFIWFTDRNSFKLDEGVYIHNSIITYFDPYTLYWLIKYKKWCKQNINLNTIREQSYND